MEIDLKLLTREIICLDLWFRECRLPSAWTNEEKKARLGSELTTRELWMESRPEIMGTYIAAATINIFERNWGEKVALAAKNLPASAGDLRDAGSIPGSGRSPGGGHGNPLQYSCLEHPMDRGAWQVIAYSVAKSQTWLKWLSTHARVSVM